MEKQFSRFLAQFFPQSSERTGFTSVYTRDERLTAAFSYLYFVSPAVLLFSTSSSAFVKLHAKHALLFLVLAILCLLLPGNFRYLGFGAVSFLDLVSAAFAFRGRMIAIPFLSELVESFEI